jgi:Domain of unknown function (DUF5658)
MKEMSHRDRISPIRALYGTVRHRLPLEIETTLFIVASALDVFMTRYMIAHSPSENHLSFVEGNPIARYFLDSWGPEGLTWFKFALVCVVSVICQVIARRKIDVARRLLYFATVMVMGVVIYSVVLMVQHT